MMSKLKRPVRLALAIALAGSIGITSSVWAQAVHKAEVASAAAASAEDLKAGETVYQTVCMACHQTDGKGIAGAFPPLAGSDYLLGNKERAVGVVLRGLEAGGIVHGVYYNSVMTAMTPRSDKERADVGT